MKRTILAAILLLFGITPVQALPTEGQWEATTEDTRLGPKLATVAEIGNLACVALGGCPSGVFAWTSFAYDTEEHQIWAINLGGHADWGGTDSYMIDLDDLATGWTRVSPVQALTGKLDSKNGCPFPALGVPAQHTYDGVVYLGNHRFLHLGSPGFCKGAMMNPGRMANFVDVSTTPFTWTHIPGLDLYGGPVATAISGQNVYLIEDGGKFAIFDKDTGVILRSGSIGAAKVNGVTLPSFSSFGSQMSSGDVTEEGIFCTANDAAIACSDINGTNPDSANDTRFGKMVRHPFAEGFSGGRAAVVGLPSGWLALWQGGHDLWLFRPNNNDPSKDEWRHYAPLTGPTPQNSYIYQKLFWDAERGLLIAYGNKAENVWTFNVPGFGPEDPLPQSSISTPDFKERCAGAFFCQGFDSAIPRGSKLKEGVFLNGSTAGNATAVLPSVQNGALKFTILNHSGSSDAGQYYVEIPPVGPGESLSVQWRQYIPESLLNTAFASQDGGRTTFKMIILDQTGTASCNTLHFVIVKGNWGGVLDNGGGLASYTRCPSSENIELQGPKVSGHRLFDSQPAEIIVDGKASTRECWKGNRGKCIPIPASVWVTYQVRVTFPIASIMVGAKERWMTEVEIWQTVNGKTDLVIHALVPFAGVPNKLGRVWFIPYMTAKDPAQTHDDTMTLIDEVILSKERIPDTK